MPNDARLHRCIRDLATLNALPSMCIGRSPDEALDIVLDALPTALSCELVYLALPTSKKERAAVRGQPVGQAEIDALNHLLTERFDGTKSITVPNLGEVWCLEAELPMGKEFGRLVAGRTEALDETDRVLVRSAANLVGTALETANVLEAAQRRDEFLAMLGHELRNPLAPIMTAVELLARHPTAARERQIIERNTRHLVRLVDDLLDISRVTSGHVELRREKVALSSVLEGALQLAMPAMTRHQHTIHVANAENITVEGDPIRLAQIFANLLGNAAKFTPPRGKIEVLVEHDGTNERVRVAVRDNGRGISLEHLARIFEPFVQVERGRDALHGGLGLGLAIVQNLVQRHRGTISVHSDGPGRGATFSVELPSVLPDKIALEKSLPQTQSVRSGVRVLVVDDNVDIAELLSVALELEGFQTAVAHNAHVALESWHSFKPHAAVLDIGLPEIDGYDLARALREEYGTSPMLIAATGYGQRTDRLRAADAGFDCHFVKPVSVKDLVTVLDERIVSALGGA